jgi:pimeloyl-ACP methyl ester carboxylesterase
MAEPSADRTVRLSDGRSLAFREYGGAAAATILYCHGVPSSRAEGDLVLDAAAVSRLGLRIVVPDRPGVGDSDPKPGRRITDWADDVRELADHLGVKTLVVVGSSGGAPYALACGARIPDRVRAIGIIGGVAPAESPGGLSVMPGPMRVMFRLSRSAPLLLRGLYRLQLRAIRRSGDRATERMAAWAPEPDRTLLLQKEIARGFMNCFVQATRHGTAGAVTDNGLISAPWGFSLGDVRVPVLLWHGERDHNVPVAAGRYLASSLPNCRATFYPEEAHLSVLLRRQEEILSALAGSD